MIDNEISILWLGFILDHGEFYSGIGMRLEWMTAIKDTMIRCDRGRSSIKCVKNKRKEYIS